MTETEPKSDPADTQPGAPTGHPSETARETAPKTVAGRRKTPAWAVAVTALVAVVVIAVAVALAVPPVRAWLAARLLPQSVPGSAEAPVVQPDPALAGRIAALEQEIATLRSAPPSQPAQPADTGRAAALEAQVRSLAEAVAKLESKPADPAPVARLAQRLDALSSKLDSVLAQREDAAADRVALLALTAALDAGRPFAPFLTAARARLDATGAGTTDLDALASFAPQGVPTATRLALRASALHLVPADAAPDADAAPSDGETGLWARVKSAIAGLVKVRRVDETAADEAGAQAGFAPVRAALAAGDLAAAGAALAAIDRTALANSSRDALAALERDLDARVRADRLARALAAALAASSVPPSGPAPESGPAAAPSPEPSSAPAPAPAQ